MKSFLLFSLVGVLAACSTPPATLPLPMSVQQTDSPERAAMIAANSSLEIGQNVYNLRCAHCHGYAGEGQLASSVPNTQQLGLHTVPPHDSTGHTWQHPSQLLRQAILQGIPNPLHHYQMPPFEGVITDEEIDGVIAYLRLWWTDEQRTWQEGVTARRAEAEAEFSLND